MAFACALTAALALNACAPANQAEVVTLGFTLEPTSLDISGTAGQAIPQVLLENVYEGLVRVNDDGSIEPSLAKSFTVSDDGLTYSFSLRDAQFHDGASLTADDVEIGRAHV